MINVKSIRMKNSTTVLAVCIVLLFLLSSFKPISAAVLDTPRGLYSQGSDLLYYVSGQPIKSTHSETAVFHYEHIEFTADTNGYLIGVPEIGYEEDPHVKLILTGISLLNKPYNADLTPPNGFVCGSFVDYIYKSLGIDLGQAYIDIPGANKLPYHITNPAQSYVQLETLDYYRKAEKNIAGSSVIPSLVYEAGNPVKSLTDVIMDDLKVGDIIFWSMEDCSSLNGSLGTHHDDLVSGKTCPQYKEIHHVGLYIGRGSVLESAQHVGRSGVVINDLHSIAESDNLSLHSIYRILEDRKDDFDDNMTSVENVQAVSNGIGSVKLTWDQQCDAEGYIIYVRRGTGSYSYLAMTDGAANTLYMDQLASDDEDNCYWVYSYISAPPVLHTTRRYVSDVGSSVVARGVLPSPDNIKVAATAAGVKLTWDSVLGADGYMIYIKSDSTSTIKLADSITSTQYLHQNAASGEYSYYWVFAYHIKNGEQILGEQPLYKYAKWCPMEVSWPQSSTVSSTSGVKLSWNTPASGAAGYIIYRKTASQVAKDDDIEQYMLTQTTANSYMDVASSSEYSFYWIRAYYLDSDGNERYGPLSQHYVYGKRKYRSP